MTCILVIEDDPSIRANIAEILDYEGYTVLQAANGSAGVEAALHALPELILCDVMMPEMDGYGVLSTLRSQPTTHSIPFVFLTAKTDRVAMRQGMDSGADDYLLKPFKTAELLAAIAARLEKHILVDQRSQQSFDELRGKLVRMLPHELRTPLSVVLGDAQLMSSDYASLNPQDIQEIAQELLTAGERLQHVIENYFLYAQTEVARYDSGQIEALGKQRIETPGALIHEVARIKASKFKRMNDLTVEAEDVAICISAESLWKIIEELVDNAFKFSTAGTGIAITARSERSIYGIQVSNQGRGMTPDQIKQVGLYMQFERQQYEQQGLGMGLILAKRLAQLASGELHIVSEAGRGMTVSVEIPLA